MLFRDASSAIMKRIFGLDRLAAGGRSAKIGMEKNNKRRRNGVSGFIDFKRFAKRIELRCHYANEKRTVR
jgi:hypothetical protein